MMKALMTVTAVVKTSHVWIEFAYEVFHIISLDLGINSFTFIIFFLLFFLKNTPGTPRNLSDQARITKVYKYTTKVYNE